MHFLSLEIDHVLSCALMVLNGTELKTPEQRQLWGDKSKFRVISRDFATLKISENIVEVEEVVIESRIMSFSEHFEARKFVTLLYIINNKGFKPILRFLLQNGRRIRNLLDHILNTLMGWNRR